MRILPEDEAEFEEDEDEEAVDQTQPQGLPASGTPPGTPPVWNPRESSAPAFRTGRAVQRIEGPQLSSIPATKWQVWKTNTGPTIADMEQFRMSPGDQETEMPDPELREAIARSLQETRHDPYETPITVEILNQEVLQHRVIINGHPHNKWVLQMHNLMEKGHSSPTDHQG